MHLGTWIVTETTATEPRRSVHFACARSPERAVELVARHTGIDPQTLSPVPLRPDAVPVPRGRERRDMERYLGPLEQFSPFLRHPCRFCRGLGLEPGSSPVRACGPCGGSGLETRR